MDLSKSRDLGEQHTWRTFRADRPSARLQGTVAGAKWVLSVSLLKAEMKSEGLSKDKSPITSAIWLWTPCLLSGYLSSPRGRGVCAWGLCWVKWKEGKLNLKYFFKFHHLLLKRSLSLPYRIFSMEEYQDADRDVRLLLVCFHLEALGCFWLGT